MVGYNTEQDLQSYAASRDVTLSASATVLLTKALDWLELQPFKGSKTSETQDNEWPRTGVKVNGTEIDDATVPARIKEAQLAAAILIDGGADLQPTIGPRVISQRVEGAVSREFSDKGNQTPIYTKLSSLLRGYVTSSGMSFEVSRA